VRTPEAHLAPYQHITHERGGHHQQEDDESEHPQHFTRRLVRTVIEAAEYVDIDDTEEEAGANRVHVADHPAAVDVAHDVLDRIKGDARVGGKVHCQHHASDDLDHQRHTSEHAEIVESVQVLRRRITRPQSAMDEAGERQALVHPFADFARRLILFCPGKAHALAPQPMVTAVGDLKA
jgi:hypothetical protein